MEQFNPYAPPVAQAVHNGGAGQQGWRLDGDVLIVDKGTTLPNYCLYDGSAVNAAPTTRTLTWVPQWVTIFAVLSPLIFLILYMVIKKTGQVGYYLGEEAKKRRTQGVLLIVGSLVLLGIGFAAGIAMDTPVVLLLGLLGFFVLLIVGAVRVRLFTLKKIDEQSLYLKLQPEAVRAFASRMG